MCNIQFDEGKTIHPKMAFCLTFDQSDSALGLVSLKPGHLHFSRTLCSEHIPIIFYLIVTREIIA